MPLFEDCHRKDFHYGIDDHTPCAMFYHGKCKVSNFLFFPICLKQSVFFPLQAEENKTNLQRSNGPWVLESFRFNHPSGYFPRHAQIHP